MADLVEWLTAQLGADEKIAKRAAKMRYDHPSDAPWEAARIHTERGVPSSSFPLIALCSPAAVLRTIAAHRAIVALYVELNEPALYEALQHIAAIYQDRDGFDPSLAGQG